MELSGVITGIVNDGNHLICILDFEKIVSEIKPDYRLDSQKIDDSLMNKKKDRYSWGEITNASLTQNNK